MTMTSSPTRPADTTESAVSLDASIAYCRDVARTRARNFYYGMKLTPGRKRAAMFAIYAWMRLADDLADEAASEPGLLAGLARSDAGSNERSDRRDWGGASGDPSDAGAARRADRIGRFLEQTEAVLDGGAMPDHPVWPAFKWTVHTFDVPHEYLRDMVEGQLLDMERTDYPTFEDLYGYCYKVASVVGLTCIEVWGYAGGSDTRQLAEWRGIAFQLTNILRDVREDALRERVYLPASDAGVARIEPAMVLEADPRVVAAVDRNIQRASEYYRRSAALDERVHADGRPCLWAMTQIYRGLLKKIRQDPRRVLGEKRVRLASWHKAWIALRASAKGRAGR